jgi:hypothetical protein
VAYVLCIHSGGVVQVVKLAGEVAAVLGLVVVGVWGGLLAICATIALATRGREFADFHPLRRADDLKKLLDMTKPKA